MSGYNQTTYLLRLPAIEGLSDLSQQLGLSAQLLHKLYTRPELFYRRARISKKTGGFRVVYCPAKNLKAVQAWILRNILQAPKPEPSATAYLPGANAKNNAEAHKGNKYFLCMDIKDFFPSIPYRYVYSIFHALGYKPHASHILTCLCTRKGGVPQGAVTSPAISNLVCIRLDRRISRYVGARNITYTRYADDITLSSNNPAVLHSCKKMVDRILGEEGFKVNDKKTRFMGPSIQRKVTGFVIGSGEDEIGVGRVRKRWLRFTIHKLATDISLTPKQHNELLNHVRGWLGYMKHFDPNSHRQVLRCYDKYRAIIEASAEAAATDES